MKRPRILDDAATLSDPTRSRLLLLLERRELTVSELCSALGFPQSTVSRHLKVLGDAGWLESRRDGTSHFYRVVAQGLDESRRGLWELVRAGFAGSVAAEADARRLERILAARSSRSEAFFAGAAERWDQLRDELFGAQSDLAALPALLDPAWRVGDLACGTGRIAAALAPFVERVVAVDVSAEMLGAARRRLSPFANVEVRAGKLEALPLESGTLDAALVVLALHHLPDPGLALAEAARVLVPGGRLVVVDMQPHDREQFKDEMGHVWLGFGEGELHRLFAAAGLEPGGMRRLAPEPSASGPPLFVATARRAARPSRRPTTKSHAASPDGDPRTTETHRPERTAKETTR